jgi:AraC family transcriptional regulator of adaptative response/methylated-DNA-[protein]-cysteine methyltransferase
MNHVNNYQLVAKTLEWVAANRSDQPDLERLSREIGLSPHHLQRTFQDWAGVSPKQFLKSLTRQAARERLVEGHSVLDAAIDSGLSGPGRLHDLMVTTEALSPGEIKTLGKDVEIHYGSGQTMFGEALISWTERGINFLAFTEYSGLDSAVNSLKYQWKFADFKTDQSGANELLEQVFSGSGNQAIKLWLRGSPFQLKVWEALMAIPDGAHASYGQIASRIGSRSAGRAVGTAIGSNPIAWIIPCHRVIRQLGELGGYRWGEITKQAMIGYEAGRRYPEAFRSAV